MAARFWLGTGGDALWSNINNWGTASGTGAGASVPTNLDDVTFDSAGNNACTVNTSSRVAKTLTITSGYTNTITFTFNIAVSGSITLANAAYTLAGASLLRMIAAGTWTTNGKAVAVPVEIGGTTTFTCTLADALTVSGNLTLTNTTSTIFAGAFAITANACTISGSQTITLSGNFNITGTTTFSDANVVNGAFNWNTYSLTTTGAVTGTAKFRFVGTGTWQGAAALSNSVDIDCSGNTLVIGPPVLYAASGTPTLRYIAGTVAGGAAISIASSCTFDTAGMTFDVVTLSAALTLTLNSLLSANYINLPNAAVTFAGADGWTAGTVNNTAPSANRIYTLANGVTYTVMSLLDLNGTASFTVTLTSDHATNKANVILGPGCDQDCSKLNGTRIDSSGGRPLFSYAGIITTCFNWYSSVTSLLNLPTNRAQTHLGS